jgi:hypothetical protein
MELDKKINLREDLEQMATQDLDRLLQAEIRKVEPNGDMVRAILRILEERDEQDLDKVAVDVGEAWERYKSSANRDRLTRKKRSQNIILRVAAIVAVLCVLVFAVPQAVNADSFFAMIARWSEDLFEFFNYAGQRGSRVEYVFKTDNPDLQQVYDATVKMGVTEPAVPMWLPETCNLLEIKNSSTPKRTRISARFANGDSEAMLVVDLYCAGVSHSYQKDGTEHNEYEYNGTVH